MSALAPGIRQRSLCTLSIGLLLSFCASSRGLRGTRRALIGPSEQYKHEQARSSAANSSLPLLDSRCRLQSPTMLLCCRVCHFPFRLSQDVARRPSHSLNVFRLILCSSQSVSCPCYSLSFLSMLCHACSPSMCCVPYNRSSTALASSCTSRFPLIEFMWEHQPSYTPP